MSAQFLTVQGISAMFNITSLPELYAHAIAIEREAVTRYREFAQWMRDLGEDHVADLFEKLEKAQKQHLRGLETETAHFPLPELSPWQYAWLFTSLPRSLDNAFPLMPQSTRDALKLALAAERRAVGFYRSVAQEAADAMVRMIATTMLGEERHHIRDIERALEQEPDPHIDWEAVYAEEGPRASVTWI
jgi:rubrerythrin